MANKNFKIGDKVKLSEKSNYASLPATKKILSNYVFGNPVGIEGEVITFEEYCQLIFEGDGEDLENWVFVKWSNNMINDYPGEGEDLVGC